MPNPIDIIKKILHAAKDVCKNTFFLQHLNYMVTQKGARNPDINGPRKLELFPIYEDKWRHGLLIHEREGTISSVPGLSSTQFKSTKIATSEFLKLTNVSFIGIIDSNYSRRNRLPGLPSTYHPLSSHLNFYYNYNLENSQISFDVWKGAENDNNYPERIPFDTLNSLKNEVEDTIRSAKHYASDKTQKLPVIIRIIQTYLNNELNKRLKESIFPNHDYNNRLKFKFQDTEFPVYGFMSYLIIKNAVLTNNKLTIHFDDLMLYLSVYLTPTWPVTIGAKITGSISIDKSSNITHDLKYVFPIQGIPKNNDGIQLTGIPTSVNVTTEFAPKLHLTGNDLKNIEALIKQYKILEIFGCCLVANASLLASF